MLQTRKQPSQHGMARVSPKMEKPKAGAPTARGTLTTPSTAGGCAGTSPTVGPPRPQTRGPKPAGFCPTQPLLRVVSPCWLAAAPPAPRGQCPCSSPRSWRTGIPPGRRQGRRHRYSPASRTGRVQGSDWTQRKTFGRSLAGGRAGGGHAAQPLPRRKAAGGNLLTPLEELEPSTRQRRSQLPAWEGAGAAAAAQDSGRLPELSPRL